MTLQKKDTLLIISLLSISFVSVYFFQAWINRFVFLLILLAAYRTKLDYVYLVWFFIINNAPGRLFSAGAFGDIRIPIYPIIPGISLSFQDLFLILYLIKYLSLKRPYPFIFKKEFLYFFMFGFIVLIYSFLLGMNTDNIISNARSLSQWSFIFIIPAYFYNKEIIRRVSLFIFPFVILALISQLFSYTTGNTIDAYLRGIDYRSLEVVATKDASRAYSSVYLILFSTLQAFYFYFNRKLRVNNNYLIIIILFAVFTILLTAIRGWIIAMGFLLIGIFLLFWSARKGTRVIRLTVVSLIVIYFILYQFPLLQQQTKKSYERLTTLESLAKGDITAEGTLQRLDVRGPRVMEKFRERPVIGWGFSDEYHKHEDAHVGHQNMLLSLGIIGYIFITGLFIHFCLKIYNLSKKTQIRTIEGQSPLIYLLGLFSVFIIHSSSTQFWGYLMYFDHLSKILFFAFFFASVNIVFKDYQWNCYIYPDSKLS